LPKVRALPILKSMKTQERAQKILLLLRKTYPVPGPFVAWHTPLELVIATVLSAQCTDKKVNEVTRKLFRKYRSARAYAHADIKTLEREIYATGFYHTKAKYLKGIGAYLKTHHHGKVPDDIDELLKLPGVSHKSANLIMAKVFGTPTGVAVDTHVKRLAPRLGLTKHHDPRKIAADLEQRYRPAQFLDVNEYFITHGRAVCRSKPLCGQCVLNHVCPFGIGLLKKQR
jgi:endonuclease III